MYKSALRLVKQVNILVSTRRRSLLKGTSRQTLVSSLLPYYYIDFTADLEFVFGVIIHQVVLVTMSICLYLLKVSVHLFKMLSCLCSAIANFSFRYNMHRIVAVLCNWCIPRIFHDGKSRVICLVTMFTPRVIVIQRSKMPNFLYVLLMPAKNQSESGQNIYVHLKDFIRLSQKILWIVGFWATISKILTFEDTETYYFFEYSAVFWYFYTRYLINGNSKTYKSYHFQKKLKKIF